MMNLSRRVSPGKRSMPLGAPRYSVRGLQHRGRGLCPSVCSSGLRNALGVTGNHVVVVGVWGLEAGGVCGREAVAPA